MATSLKFFAAFAVVLAVSGLGLTNAALANGHSSHTSSGNHTSGMAGSQGQVRHDSHCSDHCWDSHCNYGCYPWNYCYSNYCTPCYTQCCQPCYTPSYCCEYVPPVCTPRVCVPTCPEYCPPAPICCEPPCYSSPCYSYCPEYCSSYCYDRCYPWYDKCYDHYKDKEHHSKPTDSKISHNKQSVSSHMTQTHSNSGMGMGQTSHVASSGSHTRR